MLNQLINLTAEYHLVIMVATMILLVLLTKKKNDSRKVFLILAVILALSIVYELVMDEPVSRFPARINQTMNQPGPTESTNPRYYTSPEKRQLPGN